MRLRSVYFGGGTPSLMKVEVLAEILSLIDTSFDLEGVEITIEVNPSSGMKASLVKFREIGINRISIGVQSFQDEILTFLGRRHDADCARKVFVQAREAGFRNISLDLIMATAPSSEQSLRRDLGEVVAFRPEHVSAYLLTIEPGTVFHARRSNGEEVEANEDAARRQYEITGEVLKKSGYRKYEISNFALDGRDSIHNSLYWSGDAYLGLGPAAHSYLPSVANEAAERRENTRNPYKYMESMENGQDPVSFIEKLDDLDVVREAMMTGLRRNSGIGLKEFRIRTGFDMMNCFGDIIQNLLRDKMVHWRKTGSDSFLVFNEEGFLFSDDIFLEFFKNPYLTVG